VRRRLDEHVDEQIKNEDDGGVEGYLDGWFGEVWSLLHGALWVDPYPLKKRAAELFQGGIHRCREIDKHLEMYSFDWILDFILYEIVVQVEHQGVDASAHDEGLASVEPLAAALEGASLSGGGAHDSRVELSGATGSNVAPEGGARPPLTGTGSTSVRPTAETSVATA